MKSSYNNIFIRSTYLSVDINNVYLLNQVVLTQPMIKTIRAISSALVGKSQDCAISIIGPYGCGKSTSAVVAVNFLRGTLPAELSISLKKQDLIASRILPKENISVLIGERRSLTELLNMKMKNVFGGRGDIIERIEAKLKADEEKRYLLIIDEFGKFLEFAADHPEEGDVYILQRLAELANRSEGRFILVTIRHQALEAYVRRLRSKQLEEWKKIQGRFYEVVHASRLDENIKLLCKAIKKVEINRFKTPSSILSDLSNNPFINEQTVNKYLAECFPMHPYVCLLLISVFKKLAQNERSLFSFLTTLEKYGFRDFISVNKGNGYSYDIADLYDYLKYNFDHTMLESEISSMWTMIGSSIAGFRSAMNNASRYKESDYNNGLRLIKTVGLIEIFGAEVGLDNSLKTLQNALHNNFLLKQVIAVNETVKTLENLSFVTYRRINKTYHLWRGSDIHIDQLIAEEVERIRFDFNFADKLNKYFHQAPIVARKIQIEKGAFRYVTWHYSSPHNIELADKYIEGDGLICCIVGKLIDKDEIVKRLLQSDNNGNIIYLLLNLSTSVDEDIITYTAINNLLVNYQPLVKDRIARKELQNLEIQYEQKLQSIFEGEKRENEIYLEYMDNTGRWTKVSRDEISNIVTEHLNRYYHASPVIHNELINTDNPSPSAMFGLKKLLIAILENPDKENLGISGSGPEYSMYLNILRQTGIHREKEGLWGIYEPSNDDKALKDVWDRLTIQIKETSLTKVPISLEELERSVRVPPFGLKAGVAKLIVLTNVFSHFKNISLYEKGTFTPKIYHDTLDRMVKLPNNFSIQYIETGVHQYLFGRLYSILQQEEKEYVTLLEVVTPLIQFANRLPYYTKHTMTISEQSKKMLRCLLTASQPEVLLYDQLPKAFGLPEIENSSSESLINEFIEKLETSYNEIRIAREKLFQECLLQLRKNWGIDYTEIKSVRFQIKKRFSPKVVSFITDEKLKSFANRVLDDKISDNQWLLSIASLLVNKPLDNWLDNDRNVFVSELKLRYLQLEELERFVTLRRLLDKEKTKSTMLLAKMIEEYLDKLEYSEEEKIAAIANVYYKRFIGEKNEV